MKCSTLSLRGSSHLRSEAQRTFNAFLTCLITADRFFIARSSANSFLRFTIFPSTDFSKTHLLILSSFACEMAKFTSLFCSCKGLPCNHSAHLFNFKRTLRLRNPPVATGARGIIWSRHPNPLSDAMLWVGADVTLSAISGDGSGSVKKDLSCLWMTLRAEFIIACKASSWMSTLVDRKPCKSRLYIISWRELFSKDIACWHEQTLWRLDPLLQLPLCLLHTRTLVKSKNKKKLVNRHVLQVSYDMIDLFLLWLFHIFKIFVVPESILRCAHAKELQNFSME